MSSTEEAEFQRRLFQEEDSMEASMREAFDDCFRDWYTGDGGISGRERRFSDRSLSQLKSRLGLRPDRYKWAAGISASIAACLAAVLVSLIFRQGQSSEWVEMYVPDGASSELVLSDGTLLSLNSGTRVTYPKEFYGDSREIFIEGEVLAEVAKNPEMPFIVHSNALDITVLGTVFNLKSYSNSSCSEVVLLEGKVQCDIRNAVNSTEDGTTQRTSVNSITMMPGNVVQYDRPTGKIELINIRTEDYKSFRDSGSFHFYNLTLEDISKDLERKFSKQIVIGSETLAQTRFFALFTNGESLSQILNYLNSDRSMTISERNGIIYIN